MKIEYAKSDNRKTEYPDEYVRNKHGPVIKARFRLKPLPTYRALFVHFKWPADLHGGLKQMTLAAPGACHAENTSDPAHAAKVQLRARLT